MLQIASEQCAGIQVLYLPSAELRSQSSMLQARWDGALPITGIQKMHIFEPVTKSGILQTGRYATDRRVEIRVTTSQQIQPELPCINPEITMTSLKVEEWVLVKYEYDEMLYPGQVRELGDKEVKVSVMMRSGKYYKWPTSEDCIFYPISNVLMKLQPPTARPKSSRSHQTFGFTENW